MTMRHISWQGEWSSVAKTEIAPKSARSYSWLHGQWPLPKEIMGSVALLLSLELSHPQLSQPSLAWHRFFVKRRFLIPCRLSFSCQTWYRPDLAGLRLKRLLTGQPLFSCNPIVSSELCWCWRWKRAVLLTASFSKAMCHQSIYARSHQHPSVNRRRSSCDIRVP